MKKYLSSTPNAQIIGVALKAYNESITYDSFQNVLAEYGLLEIDNDKWYPQQLTLDIQKKIKSNPNGSEHLVSIGMKIVDTAIFIPMESLEEAIEAFAASYPLNFRNQADNDLVYAETVDDNHIRVINSTPHSDDMIYGYIYALVRRFSPKRSIPFIEYDDITQRDSDDNTIFNIYILDRQ